MVTEMVTTTVGWVDVVSRYHEKALTSVAVCAVAPFAATCRSRKLEPSHAYVIWYPEIGCPELFS
jgi:hypothetical protein